MRIASASVERLLYRRLMKVKK